MPVSWRCFSTPSKGLRAANWSSLVEKPSNMSRDPGPRNQAVTIKYYEQINHLEIITPQPIIHTYNPFLEHNNWLKPVASLMINEGQFASSFKRLITGHGLRTSRLISHCRGWTVRGWLNMVLVFSWVMLQIFYCSLKGVINWGLVALIGLFCY